MEWCVKRTERKGRFLTSEIPSRGRPSLPSRSERCRLDLPPTMGAYGSGLGETDHVAHLERRLLEP